MLPRVLFLASVLLSCAPAAADDWPMWRYDANHSAASPNELPEYLQPLWTRRFTPRKQAWDDSLNLDLMTYDRVFEPIVVDGRMFLGFNDQDKVVALDAATGETLWTFFTDGPVRFPAAAFAGRVFFVSDDGHLYCVNAVTGEEHWRFRGGPGERKALGNQRLTSAWPARGGPVVRDGKVYFAASIWPFMGIFIYAIDAESGQVDWVNDSLGAQYIRQPHSAPSFAGVAPQGIMVATAEHLIVPGGRSVPAVLDRATGRLKYFEINAGGKGNGGSFVIANEQRFFVHTRLKGTRAFKLDTGAKTAFTPNEPVLSGNLAYSATVENGKSVIRALLANRKDQQLRKGEPDPRLVWQLEADGRSDLIQAGSRLIAAGGRQLTLIDLPSNDRPARVAATTDLDFEPARLLAAGQRLFAVGIDGTITAFGAAGSAPPAQTVVEPTTPSPAQTTADPTAAELLSTGTAEGFAFWFGAADKRVLLELGDHFTQLAVVQADPARVRELRNSLDAQNRYGRITAHVSRPDQFMAPPYVAHMVFVGMDLATAVADNPELTRTLYETVRPYGGVMHLLTPEENRKAIAKTLSGLNLQQAAVTTSNVGVVVRRVGRLPGSGDWTHQYGDIANSVKSDDERVRLPLGVLWFGGSTNADVLPRHGHGPPEQVIGGRLFIQGHNSLSARDVYTGRVLWKREFRNLGTYDVYYDETYKDTPLDPKYNQVHIPGANARGTNYVATKDFVYIVEGSTCHALDPVTGRTAFDIPLPRDSANQTAEWGFIGVYEDVLIGGVGFANYRRNHNLTFLTDKALSGNAKGFGSKSFDRAASRALIGFDRRTGKQLWRLDSRHSFWHNGIVAGNGRIFCLDKNPHAVETALKRRGKQSPDTYRIVAIDHRTGERVWERTEGIFGTWLGYDAERDLLLQAGARASDRLRVETGTGMAVYNGVDGSLVWEKPKLNYTGPCILHNEYIITNTNSYSESAGAFRITDGRQKMIPHPVTGELQPWKISRAYGCNNIIACENFLTFRSGAAGFYDLETSSGTGNLGGFKSGCTSNLVVADGVLNAPDYTRTCSCAYQNQTSLALVHMPELDMWTVNHDAIAEVKNKRIEHIGINFGAPGDRKDPHGTLWLEYPGVAGDSPPIQIEFDTPPNWFRQHPSTLQNGTLPWVQASGVTGVAEITIGMLLEEPVELAKAGIRIRSERDDAEESPGGSVDLSSSDLELVTDTEDQLIGLRFPRVPLARGTKVRAAHIQFTTDEASDEVTELTIHAEASGSAAPFADRKHNLSSRAKTAESVKWSPPKWARAGVSTAAQQTTDIAALVQAVVNRPDWEPGNAMAFFISGKGKRVARAARDQKAEGARLIVKAPQVKLRPANPVEPREYDVRLYFGLPRGSQRAVFDVLLQNKTVAEGVILDQGRHFTELPDESIPPFRAVIGEELHIRLRAVAGDPILSGIRIARPPE